MTLGSKGLKKQAIPALRLSSHVGVEDYELGITTSDLGGTEALSGLLWLPLCYGSGLATSAFKGFFSPKYTACNLSNDSHMKTEPGSTVSRKSMGLVSL